MYWMEEKVNIIMLLIIFAVTISYFCFVFHHTASAFFVKLLFCLRVVGGSVKFTELFWKGS